MDLRSWARESAATIRRDGVAGLRDVVYPAYLKLLHQWFRFTGPGTSIYEREWDLLIVLDACRLDLLREVKDEYDFIEGVGELTSVDTMTHPWMEKTFGERFRSEMAETAYVCGSPFSEQLLEASDFDVLDETWLDGWDAELGTLPPRPVTDRGIQIARESDPERLILHYLQPHHPFIPHPDLDPGQSIDEFNEEPWRDIWARLRHGEVSRETVWDAYRDNLRHVLDDVAILLENVDADRVVITSDHGNAFGEWGVYGHPMHVPLSCLRVVPWVETTATDHETHEPAEHATEVDAKVSERLQQLGYHE